MHLLQNGYCFNGNTCNHFSGHSEFNKLSLLTQFKWWFLFHKKILTNLKSQFCWTHVWELLFHTSHKLGPSISITYTHKVFCQKAILRIGNCRLKKHHINALHIQNQQVKAKNSIPWHNSRPVGLYSVHEVLHDCHQECYTSTNSKWSFTNIIKSHNHNKLRDIITHLYTCHSYGGP